MADLTITTTNVVQGGNAVVSDGIAGVSVTAGQTGYKDATTHKWKLADNNAAGAFPLNGIFLNGAAANQRAAVITEGDVTIGATLTAGTFYFLSATPGGICPFADLSSGDRVVLVGYAKSTTVLAVEIIDTGVTL